MRILHVHLSGEFAGSERYCAGLARAQAAAGHQVRVVVRAGGMVERWRHECGSAEVLAVPGWVPGFLEGWVIGKYIAGFEAEVVHTHLGRANRQGGRAARRAGVPWVVTVHLRWKEKEMRGADGVVCIAPWQVKEVPADFKGKVRVVGNWLVREVDAGPAVDWRVRMDVQQKVVVFGSVGRLHRQKGMDVLVRAFQQAFAEDDDVRLVIVGGGELREELERLAAGDRRILLEGYAERVGDWYKAFDVYVSAARYEPFGLTLLEAMDAGLPLVCTRTEGPLGYLSGHRVRWVAKDDVGALADALRKEFRQGRRRAAHDMAAFDEARAVGEIGAFYKEVKGC